MRKAWIWSPGIRFSRFEVLLALALEAVLRIAHAMRGIVSRRHCDASLQTEGIAASTDDVAREATSARENHRFVLDHKVRTTFEYPHASSKASILPDSYGWSFLHLAVAEGRRDLVRHLLEGGADPDAPVTSDTHRWARAFDGWTPLHLSVNAGHLDITDTLLRCGARVNAPNSDQATPLHLACYRGHAEIAQLLIEEGADVARRDASGRTPADSAATCGHGQIEALLRTTEVEAIGRN